MEKEVKWSKWTDVEKIGEVKSQYKFAGVYRIRLLDTDLKTMTIARFLDTDQNGIILIGNSGDIGKRIYQFRKSATDGKKAHSEGRKMHDVKQCHTFKEKYKKHTLQFQVSKTKDKTEAQKHEIKLLNEYFKEYGEIPPLNRNHPKESN